MLRVLRRVLAAELMLWGLIAATAALPDAASAAAAGPTSAAAAGPAPRSPSRTRKPVAPAPPKTEYERVVRQLGHAEADPARVANVRDFTLRRDAGTFHLTQGTLALLKPLDGRVWGAVYRGTGTFEFHPPTEIERLQLARFFKAESLDAPIEGLVFLFADSTAEELQSRLSFAAGAIPQKAPGTVHEALDLIWNEDQEHLDYSFAKTFLEKETNSLFAVYVDPTKGGRGGFFEIDPFETEPVKLWRPVKSLIFQNRIRSREVICQFPPASAIAHARPPSGDYVSTIDEEHHSIEARFDGGLHLSAVDEIRFRSLEEGQRWIAFGLSPKLEVESVRWADGGAAEFFKHKDGPLLWIRVDPPLAYDEVRTVRVAYHGGIVERSDDWVWLDPATLWYPWIDFGGRATADLTYEVPREYRLASVGEPISSEEEGGVVRSRWKIDPAVRRWSFMVGVYSEHKLQVDSIPVVTVLMSDAAHRRHREQAGADLIEQGLAPGKSMDKQVGADVANSIAFFQSAYGPTQLRRIYAAENLLTHNVLGTAFPGLVHLDWTTFYNTQSEVDQEMVRAHEVAHQWWGASGVLPATYHDTWLSEAFAEYSALWYVQAARGHSDRYLETLRRMRERVLKNRKYLLGSGQEAGPIWLGPRTRTKDTPEDYALVIYQKGAWVLHMLRNLFLDLDTMKDDGFEATMREFYRTYAGGQATTADFQRMVEKHAGRDMSWFFRQWVYGTDIPRYRFAWRTQEEGGPRSGGSGGGSVGADAGGAGSASYRVTCRVEQQNVSDEFQMFVPVRVEFGDDRFTRLRVLIKGPRSEFDLPPFPMRPKRIVFNELESVLCETEEAAW